MTQGKVIANETADTTCVSVGVSAVVYLTPLLKLVSGFPQHLKQNLKPSSWPPR